MRILSARIFSKSFGGKIEKFSTDVTYRNKHLKFFFKKKTAHAYSECPYFSKSFGGKIKQF